MGHVDELGPCADEDHHSDLTVSELGSGFFFVKGIVHPQYKMHSFSTQPLVEGLGNVSESSVPVQNQSLSLYSFFPVALVLFSHQY